MSGHTSPDETAGGAGKKPLTNDRLFDLLSRRERRQVVELLQDADGPVDLTTLAAHVETGGGDAVDRRTVTSLDHVHLPRLAEAGVVDYDREAGTVRYRGNRRLESVLAVVHGAIGDGDGGPPGP